MRCPNCNHNTTKVIDSREANDNSEIRRRRSCSSCENRFTTFERLAAVNILVVKNNQTREPYNREKLEKGIWRALEKRNVTPQEVTQMIDKLENNWMKNGQEVTSEQIGESTMKALKQIDEVAYIRFASVYKDFQDIETFEKELKKLSTTS
jgi:transcriptional repressor NrdR